MATSKLIFGHCNLQLDQFTCFNIFCILIVKKTWDVELWISDPPTNSQNSSFFLYLTVTMSISLLEFHLYLFLVQDGEDPIPGENGHLVGWVPIDTSLRMHLWHLSVVDFNLGIGVFLHYSNTNSDLCVRINSIKNYLGKTLELIGSNINANPYGKNRFV